MSRATRIWVDTDFSKQLKKDAADAEKSVLDFTKDLTKEIQPTLKKKERNGIDFKLFKE